MDARNKEISSGISIPIPLFGDWSILLSTTIVNLGIECRIFYVIAEQIHQELRTETEEENEQEEEIGIDVYPPDFWYVLSQYIRPEDVGRFAGICRKAYNAVNCASFWFNLYKR